MIRKIICPVDFAPASQHALHVAARIAADRDAELEIVHVWHVAPLMSGEFPIPADALKVMLEDEQNGLAAAVQDAKNQGARRVTSSALDGIPWDRIVDAARRDAQCDLIVLGTHGRTGVARWMLGSVAEKVVRHAPCSVLIARGRGEIGTFRHALCPVDFSDSSRAAVDQAGQLVSGSYAKIDLLHVVEPPHIHRIEPPTADVMYDLDKRATAKLDEWATRTERAPGVAITTDLHVGDPATEVLSRIEDDNSIDLVAVGTHGRTGIHRVLVGSVAEKIVRHAPCPVLVARRRS